MADRILKQMNIIKQLKNTYRSASPCLRRRLMLMFGSLIAFNILIWTIAFFSGQRYPLLIGLTTLAYSFGLRHAVDADHIAAIDNTTRKLMLEGKRPVAVGLFFSIGHSAVVVLLSALVAVSASYVTSHLESFKSTGSLIGTLVSGLFLLIIGVINLSALIATVKLWRNIKSGKSTIDEKGLDEFLNNQGFLARLLRPILNIVTNSRDMLHVGFLFGLGFDTASEVGLLSLSAASGSAGLPMWNIMILPLAFAAGMTLIDSLNGVLMLAAYGWAYVKPLRKLYYNITITLISVVIALFIGSIEVLQLLGNRLNLTGGLFELVKSVDLSKFGYVIIGLFVLCCAISIIFYKVKKYDLVDERN